MKKKLISVLLAGVMMLSLAACGSNDEVVMISKDGNTTQQTAGAASTAGDTQASANATATAEATGILKGYVFDAKGTQVAVDMDMAQVVASLGDPDTYFEAESCAAQGMSKFYTYNHFEIDTYPDGEVDRVSNIILWDDMVATSEGLRIGSSLADMEAAYGTDYAQPSDTLYEYSKDGMKLDIIVEDGVVSSIEYVSTAL